MPVVRILLRNGVTYRAFAELVKDVFVEVAAKDYGIAGRPTNITRIAILTGLDRKTVKLIREDHIAQKPRTRTAIDKITRVLSGWYTDPEFLDENKEPKPLSFCDDAPNLNTLLNRYGGDVQATAMLKELKRVKVVEEVSKGYWRAKQRSYIDSSASPEILLRAFLSLGDVADNIHHNLYIADEKVSKRFERRVSTPNIPQHLIPEFSDFLDKEGQTFLETLDAWLTAHEVDPEAIGNENLTRLGLGMYWIERQEDSYKKD